MPVHPINLLVTLNSGYLHQLNVMLHSVVRSNPGEQFQVYVLHSSLTDEELDKTRAVLGAGNDLISVPVHDTGLESAPTTDRYPVEMYYRIFAAKYLPQELERILYLDPDIIVKGSLRELYEMPMERYLFAAASHVHKLMTQINALRLDMEENEPYINSGLLLMNLKRLREIQREDAVFDYIEKHKNRLILPDQDVISGLYGGEIQPLNPYVYNMTERIFALHPESDAWLDLPWVEKNTVILHYCGRNKPWKTGYIGVLDSYYKEVEEEMN